MKSKWGRIGHQKNNIGTICIWKLWCLGQNASKRQDKKEREPCPVILSKLKPPVVQITPQNRDSAWGCIITEAVRQRSWRTKYIRLSVFNILSSKQPPKISIFSANVSLRWVLSDTTGKQSDIDWGTEHYFYYK